MVETLEARINRDREEALARIAQLEAALSNLLLKVGDPERVYFYPMDDTANMECLCCNGQYDEMNGTMVHDLDCAYFAAKALLA